MMGRSNTADAIIKVVGRIVGSGHGGLLPTFDTGAKGKPYQGRQHKREPERKAKPKSEKGKR